MKYWGGLGFVILSLAVPPESLLIPLLLLHHHPDDPVFLVLVQDDIIILWVEGVEDFHIVVPLVLLERRLFLVILHDNVVAVLRFRGGVDDDYFAFLDLWSERSERIQSRFSP